MRNRRRKCEIASRCTKTAGQILADIAKQTDTPALATRFEGVKDIRGSPVLFSVYAKPVIPNRGSAEPWGSADHHQGFREKL